MLQSNKADVAMSGLSVMSERFDAIDYTITLLTSDLTLVKKVSSLIYKQFIRIGGHDLGFIVT